MTEAFIVVAVLMLPLFAGIAYGIRKEMARRAREEAMGYKRCRHCGESYPPHLGVFHRHPLPKDEARYAAPSSGPFR